MLVAEGIVAPLTYSSYGQILLSRQPDKQIDRVCRLIRARETNPERRFDVRQMVVHLIELRSHDYVYAVNPMLEGAGSIATTLPITIAGRDVAIGVGGPEKRIEDRLDAIRDSMRSVIGEHRETLMSVFGNEHLAPGPETRLHMR